MRITQGDATTAGMPSLDMAEPGFDITTQNWSFFCDATQSPDTAEIFARADTDSSGFLTSDEVAAGLAAFLPDNVDKEFFLTHNKRVFGIVDMKHFNPQNEKDELVGLDEFQNVMHQCLHGQPKIYWAYAFLDEAERNWDGRLVPDCYIADYIFNNWGISRKDTLTAMINEPTAANFADHRIPFWVMWKALTAEN